MTQEIKRPTKKLARLAPPKEQSLCGSCSSARARGVKPMNPVAEEVGLFAKSFQGLEATVCA